MGSSHAYSRKPCQDAVKGYSTVVGGKRVLILTIADGHGGERYDLSEFGSRIAVETMVALLVDIYKASKSRLDLFNRLKSDFPLAMTKLWRKNIGEDFKARCHDIKEEGGIDKAQDMPNDFYKRYGTTALFSLIVPEGVFFGQLGDGDIAVADRYGTEFPMPRHDELVGGQTYSLVSGDAKRYWHIRTCSISKKSLITLSTDGLANSYVSDAEFAKFIGSLYANLQKFSPDKLGLPSYLAKVSEHGSGDDVSIIGAVVEPHDFCY
jgi:hypothetical protein